MKLTHFISMCCLFFSVNSIANDNFYIHVLGDKAVVIPKVVGLELKHINKVQGDACEELTWITRHFLERAQKENCKDNNFTTPSCADTLKHARGMMMGPMEHRFGEVTGKFHLKIKPSSLTAEDFVEELGLAADNISYINPTLDINGIRLNLAPAESSLFSEFVNYYNMEGNLRHDGKFIYTTNRALTCALLHKQSSLSAQLEISTRLEKPQDISDSNNLYNYYLSLLSIWDQDYDNKKWKNKLHSVVSASLLINSKMDRFNIKKIYSVEQIFDRFFTYYIQNDEFSLYFNRFKSFEEFVSKVHPATRLDITETVVATTLE